MSAAVRSTMRALRIHKYGGPENFVIDTLPVPSPAPSECLVELNYAGVNFIDTYQRECLSDAYKRPLPAILGREGSGTIVKIGSSVKRFQQGDRVCFGTGFTGSYAEYACVPEDHLIAVPDGIQLDVAAASMLQGMTAHYLAASVFPLSAAHTCLVHAAAGGVGRLLTQLAKIRGATVIGTVGSLAKADEAKACGADHVILYNEQDFAAEVKKLTGGKGVDVVYDGVGKATCQKSLESLRPRGMLALYGNASGPAPPVDPLELMTRGSLVMTRTNLLHFTASRDELEWRASEILGHIRDGKLSIRVDKTFALSDVADAHRTLESRATQGKILLDCTK
jgi:NADPH2:quinone reductase